MYYAQRLVFAMVIVAMAFIAPRADAAVEACERPLIIRVASNYPPFSVEASPGRYRGLDIDIITDAMDGAGCRYALITLPWTRALRSLRGGDIDVMAFASRTPERDAFAYFSRPYRMEEVRLIMRADDQRRTTIWNFEDVIEQKLRIGHEIDTYRGDDFAAFIARPEATPLIAFMTDNNKSLRMLAAGRLDAVIDDRTVAWGAASAMGISDRLEVAPMRIHDAPVYLMFSKRSVSRATVDRIDQFIAQQPLTD